MNVRELLNKDSSIEGIVAIYKKEHPISTLINQIFHRSILNDFAHDLHKSAQTLTNQDLAVLRKIHDSPDLTSNKKLEVFQVILQISLGRFNKNIASIKVDTSNHDLYLKTVDSLIKKTNLDTVLKIFDLPCNENYRLLKSLDTVCDSLLTPFFINTIADSIKKNKELIEPIAYMLEKTGGQCFPKLVNDALADTITNFQLSELPLSDEDVTELTFSYEEARNIIIAAQTKFDRYGKPYRDGPSMILPLENAKKTVKILAEEPIPLPRKYIDFQFNNTKKEMISLAKSSYDKYLLTKALNNLQHISLFDLEKGLNECKTAFNNAVGQKPYSAFIVEKKSNQWVTQLAMEQGFTLPQDIIVPLLHPEDLMAGEGYCSDLYTPLPENKNNIIALFDDACYSGSQIQTHIIDDIVMKSVTFLNPIKEIYIVAPYMSSHAKNRFTKLQKNIKGPKIHIITSKTPMKSIADREIFTDEERNRLFKLLNISDESTANLLFTDWRVPDALSISPNLVKGSILNDDGSFSSTKTSLITKKIRVYQENIAN